MFVMAEDPEALGIIQQSVSVKWEEWPSLPEGMSNAQVVCLNGTVFVGGGATSYFDSDAVLYSFKPGVDDKWAAIDTPTYLYALVVHNYRLLLIGGQEFSSGEEITGKIFTLIDGKFVETLPPMGVKRCSSSAVSSDSVLFVAGGEGISGELSSVEVFQNGKWRFASPLPYAGSDMKTACNGKEWYLIQQNKNVFRVCLSLLSVQSLKPHPPCIWEKLPDTTCCFSAAAFVESLWSIGGYLSSDCSDITSSVYRLSARRNIWYRCADIPQALGECSAVVLHATDLVIVGGATNEGKSRMVYRAYLEDKGLKLQDTVEYIEVVGGKLKQATGEIEALCYENDQLKDEIALRNFEICYLEAKNQQLHSRIKEMVTDRQLDYQSSTSAPNQPPVVKSQPQKIPRGVEAVGYTSVVVTNSVQFFYWSGYGFKLNILQGSLQAGVDQCVLHISVSFTGHYQLPDGQELVSPIFWVYPDPFCQFQQKVTVEIQHCAKMTDITKLTFVKATCSQKSLPYIFKKLEGCGSFSKQSSYGSLELNHFSGFGVAGEDVERLYTASLYYLNHSESVSTVIHFVVSWNLDAHIKYVKQYYEEEHAKEGSYLAVEFEAQNEEEKKIELNIPFSEGVVHNDWKLLPLVPPIMTKQEVDSFNPGQRIPSLQLFAKPKSLYQLSELNYPLKLIGAKEPKNQIVILVEPPPIDIQPSHPIIVPSGGHGQYCQGRRLVTAPDIDPTLVDGHVNALVRRREESTFSPLSVMPPPPLASYYPTYIGSYPSPLSLPRPIQAGPHKSPIILTYDQLIENAGISGDLLNKECSDKHLWKIASLLPDWVIFAKALGLTEPQIQDILQKQHLTTNKMRALEALEKWHRQHAYNATYCHLIKLCLTLELASIARDICEIVKEADASSRQTPSCEKRKQEEDTEHTEEEHVAVKRPRSEVKDQ